VLQTDKMVYRIRPRDEKHPALLPVGEQAQFRLAAFPGRQFLFPQTLLLSQMPV
jgi:hypothetical protein